MKTKYIIGIAAGLFVAAMILFLFSFAFIPMDNSQATVRQTEGIYSFVNSVPQNSYTFLGTVKQSGLVMSGKPEDLFNNLLKKAKKEFPYCEGLIISDLSFDKADVIKFK